MSQKRPASAFNKSDKSRPCSAKNRKNKESLPAKKIGRGLGYFGDDCDNIRETLE
jgi:hypothetical protein